MAEDFGLKMSFPGVDVKTAGLDNLLIDSRFPVLKIKNSGGGSFTLTDSFGSVDQFVYTHNLGYKPLVDIYAQTYDPASNTTETRFRKLPYAFGNASRTIYASYNFTVSTTELRITAATLGGDGLTHTLQYYYILYYDPE